MSWNYRLHPDIRLHVKGHISERDAHRQTRTAAEILRRLRDQPGVVLADEVGMGKTFVALAVAASVALEDGARPVVVMVPPALRDKWPTDFSLFCERCLPAELSQRLRFGAAERAVALLKLLDDPPEKQRQILFVTHGAMSRGLHDPWVMLALIRQALLWRRDVSRLRTALSRQMADLLGMQWLCRMPERFWLELLATPPARWLRVLHRYGVDPEGDDDPTTDDDPVPQAVCEVLSEIDTQELYEALRQAPRNRSSHYRQRLSAFRRLLRQELRSLWRQVVQRLKLSLPLLILDEAHHLKNAQTRLASLFYMPEAREDADEVARGALAGAFERMLFLTATPFQLGHGELCSVLERFEGIAWQTPRAPACGREGFVQRLHALRQALDAAQRAAVALDNAWGRLRDEDVRVGGQAFADVEAWWSAARQQPAELTATAAMVMRQYDFAQKQLKHAEALLRPWVIRHLKPRVLPCGTTPRRITLPGRAICDASGEGVPADGERGIPVAREAVLPFLLAARATACAPHSRAVFAEGLASCYEAFLDTHKLRDGDGAELVDADDERPKAVEDDSATLSWYLDRLRRLVRPGGNGRLAPHPKLDATVRRVVELWRRGEKVVVYCHFVITGRVLRAAICEALDREIRRLAARGLGMPEEEVAGALERIGQRFFDEDAPLRRACDEEVSKLLSQFPSLRPHHDTLLDVARRHVRTPSFLARFFPFRLARMGRPGEAEMRMALGRRDASGLTLRDVLVAFFRFLAQRCGEEQRRRYVEAVASIQTGTHVAQDVRATLSPDELEQATDGRGQLSGKLLPNVRLVNGRTRPETRQRLMLAFNTPFYPEVLVASSVMAEGVDLHLNCRYVIHHDLCWNPSTLEQRTGRVDRIGAKCEQACRPIHVYLPYVSQTQDEKMYRVVMDRARWFSVVMGEDYRVDERVAEKLAQRVPFPLAAAERLRFALDVDRQASG